MEHPNQWVVLKLQEKGSEPVYKVLANFSGGYGGGDAWKMNSGITKVEVEVEEYKKLDDYKNQDKGGPLKYVDAVIDVAKFHGASGSIYKCYLSERSYSLGTLTSGVYSQIEKQLEDTENTVEIMPLETDWANLLETE
jgi:hypothetical protein